MRNKETFSNDKLSFVLKGLIKVPISHHFNIVSTLFNIIIAYSVFEDPRETTYVELKPNFYKEASLRHAKQGLESNTNRDRD
jgi:hypothetical protein